MPVSSGMNRASATFCSRVPSKISSTLTVRIAETASTNNHTTRERVIVKIDAYR